MRWKGEQHSWGGKEKEPLGAMKKVYESKGVGREGT